MEPAINNKVYVVISQSMYFPWVGLLEQIKLADIFVHYDDVQYARGFYNRVQIKTPLGSKWITLPLKNQHQGQKIDEVLVDDRVDWRSKHRAVLHQSYYHAPFREEMLSIVDGVFEKDLVTLADIARESLMAVARYFQLDIGCQFIESKDLNIDGSSSQRLFDIVKFLRGNVYITGHGAANYLDHQLFESSHISVEYMDYRLNEYKQLNGDFTPFVSSLDLIANLGFEGREVICPKTVHWQKFLNRPK